MTDIQQRESQGLGIGSTGPTCSAAYKSAASVISSVGVVRLPPAGAEVGRRQHTACIIAARPPPAAAAQARREARVLSRQSWLPSCTWHAEPRAEGLVDEQQGGPPGPRACSG